MIDRCCISLSNVCNLKCRYCHFREKQQEQSELRENDLLHITENIHAYCAKRNVSAFKLGIVGAGEPMLKKQLIFKLLKHIRKNAYTELKLYTITNGTLLSIEDLEEFYKYRDMIKLSFSLDGYRELHNYGRACYEKVMESIKLYETIFEKAPAINATVNAITISNKEKAARFFMENNLLDVTFSKLVGYKNADLYISDKEFDDFMRYIKTTRINCRQFNENPTYDCTMYGKLCGVGRTNIFIAPEGIYPCGRFYRNEQYRLGSYNDSFFDIEDRISALQPVEKGKCYYRCHVEGKE